MANHSRGDIVFNGSITALGLLLLGGVWWMGNSRYTILKSWPAVDAQVTKSKVTSNEDVYHTNIEFRFEADGKQFTASSSDSSDNESAAQMIADTYAPGTRHTIRYNPANPNDIRFNAGYTPEFFVVPLVLGIPGVFLTLGGLRRLCASLYSLWKSRSSQS